MILDQAKPTYNSVGLIVPNSYLFSTVGDLKSKSDLVSLVFWQVIQLIYIRGTARILKNLVNQAQQFT